jgi:hypothetical protein
VQLARTEQVLHVAATLLVALSMVELSPPVPAESLMLLVKLLQVFSTSPPNNPAQINPQFRSSAI